VKALVPVLAVAALVAAPTGTAVAPTHRAPAAVVLPHPPMLDHLMRGGPRLWVGAPVARGFRVTASGVPGSRMRVLIVACRTCGEPQVLLRDPRSGCPFPHADVWLVHDPPARRLAQVRSVLWPAATLYLRPGRASRRDVFEDLHRLLTSS
jgi:hypothetical protein